MDRVSTVFFAQTILFMVLYRIAAVWLFKLWWKVQCRNNKCLSSIKCFLPLLAIDVFVAKVFFFFRFYSDFTVIEKWFLNEMLRPISKIEQAMDTAREKNITKCSSQVCLIKMLTKFCFNICHRNHYLIYELARSKLDLTIQRTLICIYIFVWVIWNIVPMLNSSSIWFRCSNVILHFW